MEHLMDWIKRYSLRLATTGLLLALSLNAQGVTVALDSSAEGGAGAFGGELLEASCAAIGVVMYHGRGASPTGPVVEELRQALNRAGYTTLSIDNPIPLNGMTDFASYVNDLGGDNYVFPEAYARMRAAIDELASRGVQQVVVVGFSLGSRLATAHVARGQLDELPIIGLIGVGMYGNSIDPLNISNTLDEVSVPVLDVYGDLDSTAASTAAARASAYGSGSGTDYTQTMLSCSVGVNCHQLEGLKGDDSQPLEIQVNAWMQAFAPVTLVSGCSVTSATPSGDSGGATNLYFMLLLAVLAPLLRAARPA